MPHVTMRDVARRAGVSPTTVAHVLNCTPAAQVAVATRQRVMEAAAVLGYERSLLARSIKKRLNLIGIAVGSLNQTDDIDMAEIFAGIRDESWRRGYFPVMQRMPALLGQSDNTQAIAQMRELYNAKIIDGFILEKQCFQSHSITELHGDGVPVVTVRGSLETRTHTGLPIPGVIPNNNCGAQLAIAELLALGHRRIALLCRPYYRFPEGLRPSLIQSLIEGYTAALAAAGIAYDPELVRDGDPLDRGATWAAVTAVLAMASPPTAIFAGDDVLALMAMQVAAQRGLRVPEDLSVLGYGNWSMADRLAMPALSTVEVSLQENGRIAADMLIQLLEGQQLPAPQILLAPKLIRRASTAACSES